MDQQQLRDYVRSEPLDEAAGMIVMQLKQHVTWVRSSQTAALVVCPEAAEFLDRISMLLDSMTTKVVNELMIETLVPRLLELKNQQNRSDSLE